MSPEYLLKLTTGMPATDAQHQVLLDSLDSIDERIKQGEFSVVPLLLSKFVGELRQHCDHEDKIMIDLEYPRYDEHRTAHSLLCDYVNALVVLSANPASSSQVIELVRATMIKHIEQFDMSVAYYAHNKDYFLGVRYLTRGRKKPNLLFDFFKKEFSDHG